MPLADMTVDAPLWQKAYIRILKWMYEESIRDW